MYLLNVDEKKLYLINWKEDIEDNFARKLLESYSRLIVDGILEKLEEKIQYVNTYGDFAIYFKGEYYCICERDIAKVDKEQLFPKLNIDNEFLMNIFNSYNFSIKLEDKSRYISKFEFRGRTIINIRDLDVYLLQDDAMYNEFLDNILIHYFNSALNVKRNIKEAIKLEENVLADFLICHNHYLLYLEDGKLALKKRDISTKKIEEIIREAFNYIEFDYIENIISDIVNEICYGCSIRASFPFKILKWDNSYIEAVAELYFKGRKYKFFKRKDSQNVWESFPLPASLIDDMIDIGVSIKSLNSDEVEVLSKAFRILEVQKCYLKGENDFEYSFNGSEILRESLSNVKEDEKLIILEMEVFYQ